MTTTIMTKLFEDPKRARGVANKLVRTGFPESAVSLIRAEDGESTESMLKRMHAARVDESAAPTYVKEVAAGRALVVVRATYKPLGAPKIARQALADAGPMNVGVSVEERKVPDIPEERDKLNILKSHPRFLTTAFSPADRESRGPVSHGLGIPLLTERRKKDSVIHGGKQIFPMTAVIRRKRRSSVIHGGKHILPFDTIIRKKRSLSIMPEGKEVFSRALGLPTVIRR